MGAPEMKNPGGRTGTGEVNRQSDCNYYSRFFLKYQAFCLLIFLTSLIGPVFESELSLAIDRAVLQVEAL